MAIAGKRLPLQGTKLSELLLWGFERALLLGQRPIGSRPFTKKEMDFACINERNPNDNYCIVVYEKNNFSPCVKSKRENIKRKDNVIELVKWKKMKNMGFSQT